MNSLIDDDDKELADPEPGRRDESTEVKFLETLIDKLIKRLEEDSYKPRVQDALKAIQLKQKVAKTSEAEKSFWDEIEAIRQEELPKMYPDPSNLESQIKATIFALRFEVKNGILPVKTITDTYNQGKSEETRLSYQRIGRLLSTLGFAKVKTSNGSSAILWNDNLLSPKVHSCDEKN
ncbi:MAG: hypothetical protein WCE90_00210 [Candidatus Zixiibacteriota bacterium]